MRHIKNIFFIITLLTVVSEIQAQKGETPTVQAGSRNSTRSNTDKCCPDKVYIEGSGGNTKELKIDIFSNGKVKGPVEVYATDKDGKSIDISKAISFSKDDKTLKVNTTMFCPPKCDEGDIVLEFRASGKSDKIKLSNLKSWPPDAKKVTGKQN